MSAKQKMLFASFCQLNSDQLPRLLGALDFANRERVLRLNRDVDRWESALATQLALHAAASTYSKKHSAASTGLGDIGDQRRSVFPQSLQPIQWRRDLGAKPRAVLISSGPEKLAAQISVSHDEGLVVCASGDEDGSRLGVDAISIKRATNVCSSLQSLQAAARRFPDPIAIKLLSFYSSEAQKGGGSSESSSSEGGAKRSDQQGPDVAARLFCISWTLLEALAKAREVSVFSSDLKSMMMSGAAEKSLLEGMIKGSTQTEISDSTLQPAYTNKDLYPLILVDAQSLFNDNEKEDSVCTHPLDVSTTAVEQCVFAKKVASLSGDGWTSETIEYDGQIITVVESN